VPGSFKRVSSAGPLGASEGSGPDSDALRHSHSFSDGSSIHWIHCRRATAVESEQQRGGGGGCALSWSGFRVEAGGFGDGGGH